jgi:hypothetical protein
VIRPEFKSVVRVFPPDRPGISTVNAVKSRGEGLEFKTVRRWVGELFDGIGIAERFEPVTDLSLLVVTELQKGVIAMWFVHMESRLIGSRSFWKCGAGEIPGDTSSGIPPPPHANLANFGEFW